MEVPKANDIKSKANCNGQRSAKDEEVGRMGGVGGGEKTGVAQDEVAHQWHKMLRLPQWQSTKTAS